MPRIFRATDEVPIAALIAGMDIEPLVRKYAPGLICRGKEYHGRCPFPFHDDSHPSFGIHIGEGIKKGVWSCSCGEGTFLKFLMNLAGLTREQALELIGTQELFGISEAEQNLTAILSHWEMQQEEDKFNPDGKKIRVARFPSLVVDYLVNKRGYEPDMALKLAYEFDIRVCVKHWRIEKWLVVPVHDGGGQQKMWIAQDPHSSDKYNGGKTKGMLFNVHRTKHRKWCILAESIWCAIRMASYGFPCVTTFGARFHPLQAAQLRQHYNKVYLAFDKDKAGQKAKEKAIKQLTPMLEVYDLVLPKGKDPDKCTYDEIDNALAFPRRVGMMSHRRKTR